MHVLRCTCVLYYDGHQPGWLPFLEILRWIQAYISHGVLINRLGRFGGVWPHQTRYLAAQYQMKENIWSRHSQPEILISEILGHMGDVQFFISSLQSSSNNACRASFQHHTPRRAKSCQITFNYKCHRIFLVMIPRQASSHMAFDRRSFVVLESCARLTRLGRG